MSSDTLYPSAPRFEDGIGTFTGASLAVDAGHAA
jgi:hypothetical protein